MSARPRSDGVELVEGQEGPYLKPLRAEAAFPKEAVVDGNIENLRGDRRCLEKLPQTGWQPPPRKR